MKRRIASAIDSWKAKADGVKEEIYALYLAYRHPGTPWYAKVFVGLVVAYSLSPIDLIPDFIPILGYIDDLILVPLGIGLSLRMIPPEVITECREKAQHVMEKERPKTWISAVLIITIWIVLVGMCIFYLLKILK
jgi:uncharacterized membrane protein YkvA (DUF1232 family)